MLSSERPDVALDNVMQEVVPSSLLGGELGASQDDFDSPTRDSMSPQYSPLHTSSTSCASSPAAPRVPSAETMCASRAAAPGVAHHKPVDVAAYNEGRRLSPLPFAYSDDDLLTPAEQRFSD
ncbi:MAG: hypothetical protein SGPRY_004371, partial [Prymnesium sp.]